MYCVSRTTDRMDSNTPILVGIGQYVSRDTAEAADLLSPADIAAEAARRALADAHADVDLGAHVDTLAVVRLFEHSVRGGGLWKNPFGCSNNMPWSVARRIDIEPATAIYAGVGGQSPQRLVNTMCERIHAGAAKMVVLTGGEAVATQRSASRIGLELDWHEEEAGEFEDVWSDEPMATEHEMRHGIVFPIHVYALFDQARRHELGLSLDDYRAGIADMFAPFTQVAARNPYAQFPTERDPTFLRRISARNYAVCEPYTKWMVAQDAVNQGAATVLTSVGLARELGIAEERWVYLKAYADVDDLPISKRPRLASSLAQGLAVSKALDGAEIAIEAVDHIDLYSCFPIAVSSLCEHLGIDACGSRELTVTGGLPYFGGAGSNYSMHAIAEMVDRIRRVRSAHGLVAANGGYLSKHSVGVYAGELARPWTPMSSVAEQQRAKADDSIRVTEQARGAGRIESYAAIYANGNPVSGFIAGRLDADDSRFLALVQPDERLSLAALFEDEVIGLPVKVTYDDGTNYFSISS